MLQKEHENRSQTRRDEEVRQCVRGSDAEEDNRRSVIAKKKKNMTEEVIQIHKGHTEVRVQVRARVPDVPKSRQSAHYLAAQNHPHVPKCRPVDPGHVYSDVDKSEL